ncbi:hypothetical protein [Streptomyces africanus]|nr:hypothetical protein [Streptomyces africanus]
MFELLGTAEPHARTEDAPEPFQAIADAGWTRDGDAHLLTALRSGYSGAGRMDFEDVIHYEATVNGRGMTDYDLPASGAERRGTLLRRCLGYACAALRAVPDRQTRSVVGYVSLSEGGLADNLLTARVTFCSVHPGLPRYLDDMDSYTQEALLEIEQEDAAAMLAK